MSTNIFYQYLNVVFTPSIILLSCSLFFCKKSNNIIRISCFVGIVSIVFISVGARALALSLCSIVFVWFTRRFRLSSYSIMLIVFVGIILFNLVGEIRSDGVTIDQITKTHEETVLGIWSKFSDLFINNRNLYAAYENIKGLMDIRPTLLLSNICSVIPKFQSVVSELLDLKSYEMGSASYLTYLVFGPNPPMGLGTHVVADIYLSLGYVGVVICFYYLGKIVSYSILMMKNGDIIWTIIYMVFIAHAVFMCRGSMLECIKPILWSIIMIKMFNKYYNL